MLNLENISTQIQQVISSMQAHMMFSFKIIVALWAVHIINYLTKYSLNNLGIRTRSLKGLPGIILSPILHGNFNHLFFNTIPLFVLMDLVLLEGNAIFYNVSLTIIVVSGSLVWLLGQRGIHIGASSLIMGYFGYLLSKAYFEASGLSIILAGICVYYFGSLIFSVFPGAKKNVSWDGHIFGLASGIFAAYNLPNIL